MYHSFDSCQQLQDLYISLYPVADEVVLVYVSVLYIRHAIVLIVRETTMDSMNR